VKSRNAITKPKRQNARKATLGKVKRLLEIIKLLRAKPRTVRELFNALGGSRSTIHRDLDDLKTLEIGVEHNARTHTYSIAERPSALGPVEALATHAAVRLLHHHAPTTNAFYTLALEKLASQLPESIRPIAQQSTVRRHTTISDQHTEDSRLEIITRAWMLRQVVQFEFIKDQQRGGSGQKRINELEVYFIEVSRTNLAIYVIGRERTFHRGVRTYKLSRIHKPILLHDMYEIPSDFNPADYLSDAWGVIGKSDGQSVTVRLRFAPEARYRIEEGGFPNVKSRQNLPDGSIEVEITAGTDNTGLPRELLPWIQSWGPRVEVIEPQNLRQRWLEEARAVTEQYAPNLSLCEGRSTP
jgi:predicted DNA-binding transcriptional regulator YafY